MAAGNRSSGKREQPEPPGQDEDVPGGSASPQGGPGGYGSQGGGYGSQSSYASHGGYGSQGQDARQGEHGAQSEDSGEQSGADATTQGDWRMSEGVQLRHSQPGDPQSPPPAGERTKHAGSIAKPAKD